MENDRDSLSRLLKTWGSPATESTDFCANVWARIRSAQNEQPARQSGAAAILARVFRIPAEQFGWAMPVAAGLVLMLSIAAGTTAAHAYDSQRRTELMASVHARSIDPLLMAHSPAAHRHP